MRFSVDYKMSGEYLPLDYRRGFVSLIKCAMEKSNPMLFERYYSSHQLKPFTFSVYFPELQKSSNKELHVGTRVRLFLSAFSMELTTFIYNGLIKTKRFELFKNELIFQRANLQRAQRIDSDVVVFKTVSPVLVSNTGSSDRYLVPEDEGFMEGLNFSVSEMAKNFLNRQENVTIEFKPVRIKRKVIWHYHQHRSSFIGVFALKSEPEILQLIYDVGLGVRRNQGFGMLEVVQ